MKYCLFNIAFWGLLFFNLFEAAANSNIYTISGRVTEPKTNSPLPGASILIKGTYLWAVSNQKGEFTIQGVQEGKYNLEVSFLGYVPATIPVNVHSNIKNLHIELKENTLALDDVVVTAQAPKNELNTTLTIGNNALEHLQVSNVSDISALLPGGKTKVPDLTTNNIFSLRDGGSTVGNAAFGTAVEVDGVRIGNNGSFGNMNGADTRNITVADIESVEVITGVPSVEYGDLTNGVVKIVTRKGKSPLIVDVAVRPTTQSYAVSKGVELGTKAGVLNLSYERVRSVSDIASPYTSYVRNAFGLRYSNSLHTKTGKTLSVDFSLNGNVGGNNTEADPDAFKETYTKSRDNALWSSLSFNYMLNSPWLSNLRGGVTFSYADKRVEEKKNQSASSVQPALHTTEEGYFVASKYEENSSSPIILLPTGYWYVTSFNDSQPINYTAYLKARWSHKIGNAASNLLAGTDMKGEGNLGKGTYYEDMSIAPTWREYRYDELPFMHSLAAYAEEEITLPFRHSQLLLKGGLRSDMTFIPGTVYGTVSSLSPRFSVKYSFGEKEHGSFRGATLRAGWAMADGTTYYAYHTHPVLPVYNPELQWQYSLMREAGMDIRLKWVRISLSFFYNTLSKPYTSTRIYTPFDYKLTAQSALNDCLIPSADRVYSIDRTTGVVTVSDKNGIFPSQTLAYKEIHDFQSAVMNVNGSSSSRMGLEWVLDFNRIKAINTSIRIDGKYYRYKGIDEMMVPSTSSLTDTDGQPYKYIGYYVGGNGNYNGFMTQRLNTNLTLVTHVPKIRMIFSLRFEGTLLNTRQNLSEYSDGPRSYVLDSQSDYLPSSTQTDIYNGASYVATYPLYYVSREDMGTRIPFMEKFLWSAEHDKELYNELSKLVVKSTTGYMFRKQGYSPYFSANLNVSKEIGKYLTVSFFANNFFYSLQKIKNWQTDNEESLFASSQVTPFNYGISFKLKL